MWRTEFHLLIKFRQTKEWIAQIIEERVVIPIIIELFGKTFTENTIGKRLVVWQPMGSRLLESPIQARGGYFLGSPHPMDKLVS
jgi:hypothetical protein